MKTEILLEVFLIGVFLLSLCLFIFTILYWKSEIIDYMSMLFVIIGIGLVIGTVHRMDMGSLKEEEER